MRITDFTRTYVARLFMSSRRRRLALNKVKSRWHNHGCDIKKMVGIVVCLLGPTAVASNEGCRGIGLREAYNSMDVHGVKHVSSTQKRMCKPKESCPVILMKYLFIQLFHLRTQSLFMNSHMRVRKEKSPMHFFFQLMGGTKKCCSLYIAWKRQERGIR